MVKSVLCDQFRQNWYTSICTNVVEMTNYMIFKESIGFEEYI
jgi:hypothetical protein